MTIAMLINGEAPSDLTHALAANDRGFHYGDGLFETALLHEGSVRYLDAHLNRLYAGCERLKILPPDRAQLLAEIEKVTTKLRSGVLKIVLTRGPSDRGYRPSRSALPTRVVALYPAPEPQPDRLLRIRWCETRLGRNARLAGIKHLNRLEQVLAQAEWTEAAIAEGLVLDTEGEVVSGTASNLFVVRDGVLLTPDLRFCGVRGVMREQVLRVAEQLGLSSSEEPLWPQDLATAEEVFVTSAIRGVRSVGLLESMQWTRTSVADALRGSLGS
jgi:4-amino-4-deoxychorismate lyase